MESLPSVRRALREPIAIKTLPRCWRLPPTKARIVAEVQRPTGAYEKTCVVFMTMVDKGDTVSLSQWRSLTWFASEHAGSPGGKRVAQEVVRQMGGLIGKQKTGVHRRGLKDIERPGGRRPPVAGSGDGFWVCDGKSRGTASAAAYRCEGGARSYRAPE